MPLTSVSKAYKTFPSYLAERVTRRVPATPQDLKIGEPSNSRNSSSSKRSVSDACQEMSLPVQHGGPCSDKPRSADMTHFISPELPSPKPSQISVPSSSGLAVHHTNAQSESNRNPISYDYRDKRTTVSPFSDTSSESSSVLSPRDMTSPRLASTDCFRPMSSRTRISSRLAQTSPRMAVSLENVDLWEESDSESDAGGQKYDMIEGLYINPRQTIDFSDLERLRNVLNYNGKTKENTFDKPISNVPHTVPTESSTSPIINSGKRKSKEVDVLKDFRRRHKLKTSGDISVLPRLTKPPVTSSSAGKISQTCDTHKTNCKGSQNNVDLASRSVTKSRQTPALSVSSQQLASGTTPSVVQTPSQLDDKEAILDVRATMRTPEPQIHDSRVDSSSPNSRKVKFNNFVTVREGELNTLDLLRNSANSAQTFKDKYLGGKNQRYTNRKSITVPREKEKQEMHEQDINKPWKIQIVF